MPGRRFLIALGSVLFLVVVIRTAWLSELSYLTLRTIEHAANGHGFRWNVSERVQVFDHPLWMLLLLGGRIITGESYYTTFVISLALSAATALAVLRNAARMEGIVLAAMLLSLSWAFVTFSTSGLEGPLAHLLVAVFCTAWLSGSRGLRAATTLGVVAGLAAVTHVSTLLITAPALAAVVRRERHRLDDPSGDCSVGLEPADVGSSTGSPRIAGARTASAARDSGRAGGTNTAGARTIVVWAVAPLLAWAAFATLYYGTPVPLPVVAEWTELAGLGARLHAASRLSAFVMRHDPITLAVILAALVLACRPGGAHRPLAWGVVAYIAVLAVWAGDGMAGRWLALPFLVSALLIVRHPAVERPHVFAGSVAASIALATVPSLSPLQSDVRFGTRDQFTDRRDPRAADYRATGLLHDIRQWYPPQHPEATRGGVAWQDTNRVKTSPHPAYFGFAAGYGVHVIDRTGRTDPLLARLRPAGAVVFPRAAERRVPDGYDASLPDKENAIRDSVLAAYYDRVRFATRGPLGDPRRVLAALRLAVEAPPDLEFRPRDSRLSRFPPSHPTGGRSAPGP